MRKPITVDYAPELIASGPADGQAEIHEELQRALTQIRDDYRLCFILFYQQEMSLSEIADTVGRPEGTIKTWLHRARRQLANLLQHRGFVAEANHELR